MCHACYFHTTFNVASALQALSTSNGIIFNLPLISLSKLRTLDPAFSHMKARQTSIGIVSNLILTSLSNFELGSQRLATCKCYRCTIFFYYCSIMHIILKNAESHIMKR